MTDERKEASLALIDAVLATSIQRLLRGDAPALVAGSLQGALTLLRSPGVQVEPSPDRFGGSIALAKEYVFKNLEGGVPCPVCGQLCKLYPRKLYGAMVAWLVWLVRAYEQDPRWYSVNEGPVFQNRKGGGDYSKLEYWGLIQSKPNEDPTKRTSGIWRPTAEGCDFVHQRSQLPAKIWVFDDTVFSRSENLILIGQAVGERFDYAELMAGRGYTFGYTDRPTPPTDSGEEDLGDGEEVDDAGHTENP